MATFRPIKFSAMMECIDIENIIRENAYPDSSSETQLIETHISWVLLTPKFAFKIKKPVQFSFLDFSTLEKRKFYCERELELNQRLAGDMYLSVVPIRKNGPSIIIDGNIGEVVDYAVKMKRMNEKRQMDLLLASGEVTPAQIIQLAGKLAKFHAFAEAVNKPPDINKMQEDFADILSVKSFIIKYMGRSMEDELKNAIKFSDWFLKEHEPRILERHRQGFTIDGHGDLHSKNIFLLDEPVVFDCIEFNDSFRQVDVLNDLAFFCMDLDFYGSGDLEAQFLQHYLLIYPCLFHEEDHNIFQYYKLYRANVRAKVNALKAKQATDSREQKKRMGLMEKYIVLMNRYRNDFFFS